jgi:hypothetical protein
MSAHSPISPWSRLPGSPPRPGASGSASSGIDTAVRIGPQFQVMYGASGQVSNWDRCNWCGMPRSSHGIDWSCPAGNTTRGTRFVAFVCAAGVLALIGIGLLVSSSQTSSSLGSLGAAVLLSGLVMLICTGTIISRRG